MRRNTRHTAARLVPAVVILITVALVPLSAQAPYNPFAETEAPPALLDLAFGDSDVDFYLLGSWSVGSVVGYGVAVHPPLPESGRRLTAPYPFPGFETRLFYQTVDLTLSLWLRERFFFEASVTEDRTLSSIAAGYYGAPDETVRSVIVGVTPLDTATYPYIDSAQSAAGSSGANTPGLLARFGTGVAEHELMLRLENTTTVVQRYRGTQPLDEQRIPVDSYVRGRAFVLPDGNVHDVRVYVEDETGSVAEQPGAGRPVPPRRYRRTADNEFSLDPVQGVVVLRSVATARVLVHYRTRTAAGAEVQVGSPGAGRNALIALDAVAGSPTDLPRADFSFDGAAPEGYPPLSEYKVPVAAGTDTLDALLLFDPARFNPFESGAFFALSGQPIEQLSQARIELSHRGSRRPLESFRPVYRLWLEGTVLQVSAADAADPRDLGARYPFARIDGQRIDAAGARLYGPGAAATTDAAAIERAVSTLGTQDTITLEGAVVPGSVRVQRNGLPLSGIEVDYQARTVHLPAGVGADDLIEVTYRRNDGAGDKRELAAVVGSRVQLTDELSLAAAAGIRWSVQAGNYSTRAEQNPGIATASLSAAYSGERLSAGAAVAFQLYQSDTTGVLRAAGFDERVTVLAPRSERILPAAAPADDQRGITPDRRARALYRRLWQGDALGNVRLAEITASVGAESWELGGWIGPYAARDARADTAEVMVLEWGHTPLADAESAPRLGPGQWTGGQLSPEGAAWDLRGASRVTMRYRFVPGISEAESAAPLRLLIDFGAIDEDTDGDGRIARGRSGADPALPFDWGTASGTAGVGASGGLAGARMWAGVPVPGRTEPYQEDRNRNGVLDRENPAGLVQREIVDADLRAATDWRTVEIFLDPDERRRLSAVRGVRFIVQNTSDTADSSGALVVGEITFHTAPTAAAVENGSGTVAVRSARDTAQPALADLYPSAAARFGRDALTEVLELQWNDVTASGSESPAVLLRALTEPLHLNDYEAIVVYLNAKQLSAITGYEAQVELRLVPDTASAQDAVEVRFPAALIAEGADRWHELRAEPASGRVFLNGDRIDLDPLTATQFPSRAATVHLFELRVYGASDGTLQVDELHLSGARSSTGVAGSAFVEYRPAWRLRDADENTIFGVSRIYQSLQTQTTAFRPTGEAMGGAAASASAQGATFVMSNLAGSSAVDFEILRLTARVEGEFAVDDEGTRGFAGHTVRLPIAAQHLTIEDRYRHAFAQAVPMQRRELSLTARAPAELAAASLSATAAIDRTTLRQGWRAEARGPADVPLQLSATLDATLTAGSFVLEERSYVEGWSNSTALLRPWYAGDEELRGTTGNARVALGAFGPYRLRYSVAPSFKIDSGRNAAQLNRTAWTFPTELTFEPRARAGGTPLRITPRYTRAMQRSNVGLQESFREDVVRAFEDLNEVPLPFTEIPFAELYDPRLFERVPLSGAETLYRAGAEVETTRAPRSRPIDLLLPNAMTAGVERAAGYVEGSATDRRIWRASFGATALNLFGQDAAQPRFAWYALDEFRTRLAVTLTEGALEPETATAAALDGSAAFFGRDEREFRVRHAVKTTFAEQTSVDWSLALSFTRRDPDLASPRWLGALRDQSYYRHIQTATLGGTYAAIAETSVILRHETELVVAVNGSIRAYAEGGWIVQHAERLHIIGLRAGIEGALQF